MDPKKIILGIFAIIVGLIMLPIAAGFLAASKADTNVAAVTGLNLVLDLILYGVGFGLVFTGINMIHTGRK